jgi:uncharacterized protein
MKLTQDIGSGVYRIRSYEPGRVRINDEQIEQNVVVSPDTLIRDWEAAHVSDLTQTHIDRITALEPEVVILGTGEKQQFPERSLLRGLLQRGIGIEVMDTASACRTYNILMAEDRRVAAALILR